ncbi:hypothetical protein D3C87_2115100 [compost metagenome]
MALETAGEEETMRIFWILVVSPGDVAAIFTCMAVGVTVVGKVTNLPDLSVI